MALDGEGRFRGDSRLEGKVGIVDIGTYTTDLLLVDRLTPVRELSATLTIGVDSLARRLAERCTDLRNPLVMSHSLFLKV